MRHLSLTHSGLTLSRIVCGCWQAGRDLWPGARDEDSIAALRAAFDAGITSFDTAEDYGDGHSERILAEALGPQRDQIMIASKVSWDHLSRAQLIAACERSLARLGTDRIDLYQIHWPAGTFGSEPVAIEESLDAMRTLKEQGKVRAIGVSNFSLSQLEAAAAIAPIDTVQPAYSLLWRHIEADLVPFCQRNQIAILAYSPLAQGLLTGRFGPELTLADGDNRADNRLFQAPLYDRALALVDAMTPLAAARGLSLAQLSLAWLLAQPMTAAIAGARVADHAVQNAAAGDIELTPAELSTLDQLSREFRDLSGAHGSGSADSDRLAGDDSPPVMWTWET
ncbi:MAG: aldo/keto reductase [Haliangiales bacterium]